MPNIICNLIYEVLICHQVNKFHIYFGDIKPLTSGNFVHGIVPGAGHLPVLRYFILFATVPFKDFSLFYLQCVCCCISNLRHSQYPSQCEMLPELSFYSIHKAFLSLFSYLFSVFAAPSLGQCESWAGDTDGIQIQCCFSCYQLGD